MNFDTFTALKAIMKNLECEKEISIEAVQELQNQCQEALQLIQDLRFKNNSAHVKLATKQAVQYINKALFEIKAYNASYNPATKTSQVSLKDICSPVHAGMEIILNLNY